MVILKYHFVGSYIHTLWVLFSSWKTLACFKMITHLQKSVKCLHFRRLPLSNLLSSAPCWTIYDYPFFVNKETDLGVKTPRILQEVVRLELGSLGPHCLCSHLFTSGERWRTQCKVDHVNSHPTYALGGLEEAPGPQVSLVLPVTNCASGLCQAFSGCHVPYQGGSTLSRFHCRPLTLIRKVFWIVTLGTLSNHWPWNISSFLETLFLRKGCQKPFGGRVRKMPAFGPGPAQAPAPGLPQVRLTRRAAHAGAGPRHTCRHSSQKTKWTNSLVLQSCSGVWYRLNLHPPSWGNAKLAVAFAQTSGRMRCQR